MLSRTAETHTEENCLHHPRNYNRDGLSSGFPASKTSATTNTIRSRTEPKKSVTGFEDSDAVSSQLNEVFQVLALGDSERVAVNIVVLEHFDVLRKTNHAQPLTYMINRPLSWRCVLKLTHE